MSSATMTIRLESEEKTLILDYAHTFGISALEFIRTAALERIEDALDLKTWEEVKVEFESDPTTISSAAIAKKYL